MENDDRYAVPDDWEEAEDDSAASQLLQQKIEEAARIKQLQQQSVDNNIDMNNDQQTKMLMNSGNVPVFKILKRPESSGELMITSIKTLAAPGSDKSNSIGEIEPSNSSTSREYGAVRQDATNDNRNDATAANQARTLEERVMAYAQARERIFGVVDQGIHEELPILPKLIPRTTPATPSLTPTSATNK